MYCYRLGTRGRAPPTRVDDRPSVTELPGLTSDPIYTADRRGGILISSGPNRRPLRVLNPSRWPPKSARVQPGFVGPGQTSFATFRSALYHLRASNSPTPESTGVVRFTSVRDCPVTLKGIGRECVVWRERSALRSHSKSMGRVDLSPSKELLFARRFQGTASHVRHGRYDGKTEY